MANIKEIDLTQIWQIIKKDRKKIFISSGITTFIAIIYCIFATPIFTGRVIINPPKLSDASNSGFAPTLSSIGQLGGGITGLLQKADSDIITSILSSDAISDMVIKKFDLIKRYKQSDIEYTRLALASKVVFISDIKSGFLEIDADDPDPKVAAAMANYYTVALGALINTTEYNRSKQKANFFASQLPQYKNQLIIAESALKNFSTAHNITAGEQGQVVTVLTTQLAASLADAQSRLQAMSSYATPQNAEYQQAEAKVKSLSNELAKLSGQGDTTFSAPAGLTPELAQQYYNLVSDVRVAQEIYLGITKRYQGSLIDMIIQMQPVVVQVINPASVPIHKSKPKRLRILVGSILGGLFIGSVFVVIRNRKMLN